MISVIDIGSTHVRHLVADASGKTLCNLKAAHMYSVKAGKETGYILCPKCDKARADMAQPAEASS